MRKWVHFYGNGRADGGTDKALLGGKGAGLAEMSLLGLPVPPGLTITTRACLEFYEAGRPPAGLFDEVRDGLREVEAATGLRFGDTKAPLLLSVRSGARASMPGMMDTVLNLGLNDETVEGLARRSGGARFAFDSYRRLLAMYGDVVFGIRGEDETLGADPFEEALKEKKRASGVRLDHELGVDALKELVAEMKSIITNLARQPFPQDPWAQLEQSILAVFRSWENPRAKTYRRLHNIPSDWGTAVSLCTMVFGNAGNDSCTGVAFTRDPNTGARRFFGEYLVNAQGEDVVAGIRTPAPIHAAESVDSAETLERTMPEIYHELDGIRHRLEKHFGDMQDIEFTVENKKLWILQTRNGKRSAQAAVQIAHDMVHEGLIDKDTAVLRVSPEQLDQLLHPMVDPTSAKKTLAKGLPASPGAASGRIVLTADDAQARAKRNESVVLVRIETSPEDVHGMHFAKGILTARGGMTSHAAVVARGMGRPCVVGASELHIDMRARTVTARGNVLREGDVITIDGTTGEVLVGTVATVQPTGTDAQRQIMAWADEARRMRVRANADTPEDAKVARRLGAEGIGLCRTEHMFFEPTRILAMREMIVADDEVGRRHALSKLLTMQRADFEGIFAAMAGTPVTIRLLDPPLHEFLPKDERDLEAVAKELGRPVARVRERVAELHEFNPMLGLRGCRLGLAYPEVYEMQVEAIAHAACTSVRGGVAVAPEIMIPLVSAPEELRRLRAMVLRVANRVMAEERATFDFTVGTMIEVPRAAILADRVAVEADFFSFGTNDLTQMTFGLSRDDSGSFLPKYVEEGVLVDEPFTVLDPDGVGELVRWAVARGRATKPNLKIGICGEHGGEPRSVAFCDSVGLDYVSCSPYRVPIARLAAAHASILARRKAQATSKDGRA